MTQYITAEEDGFIDDNGEDGRAGMLDCVNPPYMWAAHGCFEPAIESNSMENGVGIIAFSCGHACVFLCPLPLKL